MKFSELNKGQKQKLILGVLLACGGVYALWNFGVQPIITSQKRDQQRIESLKTERRKEQLLLASGGRTDKEYRQLRDSLHNIIVEYLPPHQNAIAWAAEIIGAAATESGIPESALAIQGSDSGKPFVSSPGKREKNAVPPLLEQYTVSVTVKTPYHRLGRFVAALEERIPYVVFGEFSISPKKGEEGPGTPVEVSLECIFPRFNRTALPESAMPDAPKPVIPSVASEKGG